MIVHTAIAVTGYGVFSFGNADPNREGRNIIGGSLKDYLFRELPPEERRSTLLRRLPNKINKPLTPLERWTRKQDFRVGLES